MSSMRPNTSYSNESINEVCSSTASLSVSSSNPIREYDSPTVVSYSSSTAHSDQFDDAPEESVPSISLRKQPPQTPSMNPLEALAMACAAENNHQPSGSTGVTKGTGTGTSASTNINIKNERPQSPTELTAEGSQSTSFQISQSDVLCGRGGLTNHHPGNVFFRRLVRIKQESYLRASKREKAGVAREIVDVIRNLSPSGRFLKKDTKNPGMWIEIGDRKAREKTSQALREGAPELREELNSEKVPVTDEMAKKQATFMNDGARAILDTMRHHQAQTWQQMTADGSDAQQKPPSVNSNRIRIVSSDSNLGGVRHVGAHSTMLPLRQMPLSSQTHVIMDDHRPPYPTPPSNYRHPQPDDLDDSESFQRSTIGSKRKSIDLASNMSSSNGVQSGSVHSDGSSARGPRLKLLKQRLQSTDY